MSSSYSLYRMINFPKPETRDIIAIPRQMPIDYSTERAEDPPRTELTYLRTIEDLHIDVYRGLHEFIVNTTGRARGVDFTSYTEIRRFTAYYYQPEQLLMLKTNKPVAQGAMKQLIKYRQIEGERRHISLSSIKALIQRFKGAWFSVADSANVHSQALFGASIDQDLLFERASEEGEMYYVTFDYEFRNELFHIGVSRDCNVVVHSDDLDEYLELELVLDVKRNLVDAANSL